MGAKGEISWKRRGEYGERMEYYARNERGTWNFFSANGVSKNGKTTRPGP